MNVTLWIVQGLLAFAFIAVGAMKLFAYEKYKAQSEKNGPAGITRGLAAFIGVAEIAGGFGIVLPLATNIAPSLSLWAAVGLSTIMLLAIGFHLRRDEAPVAPAILFLLTVFVVFCVFPSGGKQGGQTLPRGFSRGSRTRHCIGFALKLSPRLETPIRATSF